MTLTKIEAENILTRVFSTELQGSAVIIEDTAQATRRLTQATAQPPTPAGFLNMAVQSLERALRCMAKQPNLKIDAIKFYREMIPGTGLSDAKEYVERLARIP